MSKKTTKAAKQELNKALKAFTEQMRKPFPDCFSGLEQLDEQIQKVNEDLEELDKEYEDILSL
jgi:archaellum component FlaC